MPQETEQLTIGLRSSMQSTRPAPVRLSIYLGVHIASELASTSIKASASAVMDRMRQQSITRSPTGSTFSRLSGGEKQAPHSRSQWGAQRTTRASPSRVPQV